MNKTDFKVGMVVEKNGKQGRVISIREDRIITNMNGIMESSGFDEVKIIKKTLREFKEEVYKKINKTKKEEVSIDSNTSAVNTPYFGGNNKLFPAVSIRESLDSLFEEQVLNERKKVKEDTVGGQYNSRLEGSPSSASGLSNNSSIVTENAIKEWLMREDVKQMFRNRYGSKCEEKMMEAAKRMNEAAMERKSFNNVYSNIKKKTIKEFPDLTTSDYGTGYAKQGTN